jgi:hypothetical protein
MAVRSYEASEELSRALGETVVRIWGGLPADLQNHLFREAVTSRDEKIRPRLAIYLHEKHPRTHSREITEVPFCQGFGHLSAFAVSEFA